MSSSLKLATLIDVGPLDRYGYQHIYQPVLANLAAFSARIYICSSSRNRNGVDEVLDQFHNVVWVSDESTWFPLDDQGNEVFRLSQLSVNSNKILNMARLDGMDCAAAFAINQYLPENAQERFFAECESMVINKDPFCWMYKRIQLSDQLFQTDRRIPLIINLHYPKLIHFEPDAIRLPNSGEYYRSMIGDFREMSNISTVDVPREMTTQDLEEMRCFIRNYDEINPGTDPTFIWERDGWRETTKYSAKQFSNDPLSPTGQIIARSSRPDFVSQYLLKAHPANAPWHVKFWRSIKTRVENASLFKRVKRKWTAIFDKKATQINGKQQ